MHYVCERCSSTFKLPEHLRKHLRQEEPCSVSPRLVPEDVGFDQEIEKKLRSRKKIDGQTEQDKWIHMFRLLFPSFKDGPTPSPYAEINLWDEPPTISFSQKNTTLITDAAQPPVVSDVHSMTVMAAAAEQSIRAVEKETRSAVSSSRSHMKNATPSGANDEYTDGQFLRPSTTPSPVERGAAETSTFLQNTIRQFVVEEVRAALSTMPSCPAQVASSR
ncbi:Zinc finger, C2H2 [Niveomyces insectorum RCEF 264]|uniref:Zinc finger, C2H2 n=1 Tax=Niveomyces insectorum RCEF 264 TaxID=1081102 RepID=A0A162JZ17_9HYPO|nr:Zinc finger, C2H2 [Niveomyces insectorum RCEF 264]